MKKSVLLLACAIIGMGSLQAVDMTVFKTQYYAVCEDSDCWMYNQYVPNYYIWGSYPANTPFNITNATQVVAGYDHGLILDANGIVTAFGATNFGQCDVPLTLGTNITQIIAGKYCSGALLNDGTVCIWGNYGNPNTNVIVSNAVPITKAILTETNELFCLLSDSTIISVFPDSVTTYTNANVTAIAGNIGRHLILTSDGKVKTWGGTATNVPASITNVIAIAQGSSQNVVIRGDNTAAYWTPTSVSAATIKTGTNLVISAGGTTLLSNVQSNGIAYPSAVRLSGTLTMPVLPVLNSLSVSYGGTFAIGLKQ